MGKMLIALDDETEKELRRLAKQKYGDKKGSLQRVVTESIKKLIEDEDWKKARRELLASMERGYNLGLGATGVPYKTRDEIYDD